MAQTILIIEDEVELANILAAYLEVEGFQPQVATDGEEGLKLFHTCNPGLVLLDIMLPKVDGISVCKEMRMTSDVPVIMISAKSGEMDKVVALGIGADDYVTKPFSPMELVARVKAQLRRYEKSNGNTSNKGELTFQSLTLNHFTYTADLNGRDLELTTKEFDVLWFLANSPGQVFSKEQIYQGVWGYESIADENSVTVYVNRIRDKLGEAGETYIKTVWGAGYKFYEVKADETKK